jgi:hypothetical protein
MPREDESEVRKDSSASAQKAGFPVFFGFRTTCHPAWIGKAYWRLKLGSSSYGVVVVVVITLREF